ncbi:MAG: hypothetical protein FJZ95_03125 [Chloroflexi bacterium]|nr:hypothetical protein [Chloroflexota bacterium]
MTPERQHAVALPPVEQIGIVVKDIEKAVEYYTSTFGWGPFTIQEHAMKGPLYRGKPTDCRLKLAIARSGTIEIELIQVLEGETPHTEFLREKGEGLHHLRFRVDDLNAMLTELAREGIEPLWYQSLPKFGVSFAYLDTDKIGGVIMELIEVKGGRYGV